MVGGPRYPGHCTVTGSQLNNTAQAALVLLKGVAAINDYPLPRDARRGFGSKKRDRGGDVVRATRAADGSI